MIQIFLFVTTLIFVTVISPTSIIFGEEYVGNSIIPISTLEQIKKNEEFTKPTFGVDHENGKQIVENGFIFNNQTFNISNNFHTPFVEKSIHLDSVNYFEAKVYAPQGLKVQEFLFGIPAVGQAHLSELGIEIWFDRNGKIEEVKTIQKSNVIRENEVNVIHKKINCKLKEKEEKCDQTSISIVFLEPLKDKVMAIKGIDYKNRYQITYLNEGFEISEPSLNPPEVKLIPSPSKGEGLLQVYQIEKYSSFWISEDGRLFERNNFDSFKQINKSFTRFQDSGEPLTRNHSGFKLIIDKEKENARKVFNATNLESHIPESYSIDNPIGERITDQLRQKMEEQKEIAQRIINDQKIQARFY